MLGKYAFITIYCGLLIIFSTYISILEWYEFFTCFFTCDSSQNQFDYVIVGGGTAGTILALRLSQNPKNKVLLLEAGSWGNSDVLDIPLLTPLLHKSAYDWQYKTVPQKNACWAFKNNASLWPTGKILGGSGRLNHMLYTRGHPDDYKEWYKDDPDFNYDHEILYYMKKSENQVGSQGSDLIYHNKDGPLTVNDLPYHSELYETIFKVAQSLNLPIRDINGKFNTGFSPIQVNIKDGKRHIPIHSISKKNIPNLTIRTHSTAKEILLKSKQEGKGVNYEAYGVNYEQSGKFFDAFGKKGVILTSGTIGSAKLLMLSGIGPKKHLKKIGIKPKINLPVGKNLQDHLSTGFDLILFDKALNVHKKLISPWEVVKYLLNKNGVLTSVGVDVLAFLNTNCLSNNSNYLSYDQCESKFNNRPDIEFLFMQAGIATDFGIRMRHIVGLKNDIWKSYYKNFLNNYTVSFLPILLRPKSRGYIQLRDNNFESKPIINPNYLSDESDVEVLIKGIRFIKKFVETEPMKELGAKFNKVIFPPCKDFKFNSDDYWKCYLKYMSFTIYHPIGTCKMGNVIDPTTVVSKDFQVKGTNKLFVADASIIPKHISANINAAVAMIAEKATDTIKMLQAKSESQDKNLCEVYEVFLTKKSC